MGSTLDLTVVRILGDMQNVCSTLHRPRSEEAGAA